MPARAAWKVLPASFRPSTSSVRVSVTMRSRLPRHRCEKLVAARVTLPRKRCPSGSSSARPITIAAAPEPSVSEANSARKSSRVVSGRSRRSMVRSVIRFEASPLTISAYSMSPRSIMRAAISMPFRKPRQALPTSKFWQVSARPRLPCTIDAVLGSIKSRQTELLIRMPIFSCGTPDAASAFCAAQVAASEGWVGPSQIRRAVIPATSSNRFSRMPKRSRVGARRRMISSEERRIGASTWATDAIATCL